MSMNARERRLAVIVGALFVCFVGYLAYAGGIDPFDRIHAAQRQYRHGPVRQRFRHAAADKAGVAALRHQPDAMPACPTGRCRHCPSGSTG